MVVVRISQLFPHASVPKNFYQCVKRLTVLLIDKEAYQHCRGKEQALFAIQHRMQIRLRHYRLGITAFTEHLYC